MKSSDLKNQALFDFFLMFTMITNIFFILWLSVELIFALITFLSLLVICAPTHISHYVCEKWKFSKFYRENVKKIIILYGSQNLIVMLTLSVELNWNIVSMRYSDDNCKVLNKYSLRCEIQWMGLEFTPLWIYVLNHLVHCSIWYLYQ